ncbi:head maturation protease, ClpP-related [Bosea eneae]|uniref:ATP-dependent Clp protease proteolytic subunit n=1 Tax=Bosea eneae TaxID=151454 RepID=A0ABW0J0C8_9HYPH
MNRLLNLLRNNARRGEFRAEGNTLYIYDVIVASDADAEWFGGVSAERIVKAIAGMSGEIALRLNSPGGDVFAARAIMAAMAAHGGQITAYVDGYAASAASIIAAAAGKVVMADGSFLMIHKAWTLAIGNADDMLATATLLEKIDGTIADTYAARAGESRDHYAALMAAETWFTAQEAVDEGLADEIASQAPKSAARWDLSAYQSAPAPAPDESDENDDDAQPATMAAAEESARRQRVHAVRMRLTA